MKRLFAILLVALTLLTSCVESEPLTYEEFWALSGDEQLEYKESFKSTEAFYAWYNDAKKAYIEANPGIDIGDGDLNSGELDLGELNKQHAEK